MATRMLQRRGTAAEWAAANPVLGDGEVGVERDTGVMKIGDGVAAWAALTNAYRRFVDSVAKAGDTMTGNLTILKDNAALLLQETVTDRLQIITNTGTQYVQVDDELHITAIDDAATLRNLRAGEIYDTGSRVYSPSNPQPATNPFAVVDAAGDLLVGSANDAVARLAKGPNGSVLTISSGGVVVWQTPVDASTKVSKTGDTMTGKLVIDADTTSTDWGSATLEIQDTGRPRIAFHQPGQVASSIGQEDGQEWIRTYNNNGTGYAPFYAGPMYDGGNRVYSASNPPPASGAMINQTIRGSLSVGGGNTGVTIPSVNMAKSQLRFLGTHSVATTTSTGDATGAVTLSSSTMILVWSKSASARETFYELTEWT